MCYGPVMLGWNLMFSANGSIRILKMNGDKGNPCLIPLVMCIGLELITEVRTIAYGEE